MFHHCLVSEEVTLNLESNEILVIWSELPSPIIIG